AQYSVSYHESAQDAADNAGPITNPASYISTGGIVFIRVTNNATGCYDVVELELIVHPLPQANPPTPYTLCDENTVNGQPDETEVFDLTSKTEEIIGTQDGINLTFHHTLADAEAGTNAIANPEAYTNQSTVEAIYVRVTFEATDCYRIVLLDIRVAPLPVLVPPSAEDLLVCDPDGDGFAQFDLEALVEDMVDNGEDLSVTFHETAIDAENGLNPIPNTDNYTNNVAYAQTIYVRVENTVTGCYTATAYALDLVVVDA
ncbi:hypothetical protein V1389_17895, partial [Flavobacterium rakeshii]|nr:hypothetical protein [Flavobacterium rakeshii]